MLLSFLLYKEQLYIISLASCMVDPWNMIVVFFAALAIT